MMTCQLEAKQPCSRGFTLIELVVVIAIILLLLGLTLSTGLAIRKQSEVRETKNTLRLLDTAMQEWHRISDRSLSWGINDNPPGATYDLQGEVGRFSTPPILIITELLEVVNRPELIKNIITHIDSNFMYRYKSGQYPAWIAPSDQTAMDDFAGGITVLDAWGWPIYATHPGRVATPDDHQNSDIDIDEDGTVNTFNESRYGTVLNRRVVFVSAGPDGEFGIMIAQGQMFEKTKDNIFSTPVDR